MFVYIAEVGMDYEPAYRIAVFSDERSAQSWTRKQRIDDTRFTWDAVTPYKVDDPSWMEY